MFGKRGANDDKMSLVEAWQVLGERHRLAVTSSNSEAIVATGVVRGRSLRVDIHRNRKLSEPFQGMAEKHRRRDMRYEWTTELTVACVNPRGLQGALQSFVDIRDPARKPRDGERCRIVRTEPASLAQHVLNESIHARLDDLNGDQQILIEPRQIRLTVDSTSLQQKDAYFTGSPLHVEYPGPWPATFRERALVGPPWWFDLLCDIADAVDGQAPDPSGTWSPPVPAGSSFAQSGGPFGPEAYKDGRGKVVTFALLAGALVIAGIGVFAFTRSPSDEGEDTGADPIETVGTSPTTGATEAAGTTTPQAPDDPGAVQVGELFTGTAIAMLIDEIAVANGTEPMRALSVLVYPEYLTAQVQGPGAEQGLIEYRWVGQLTPATPATTVPNADVAAALFGSDEVTWSAIPALIGAAPGAVSVEGGVVTHVDVKRSLPFSADIRIRVFVSGPGGDGFVDGDAAGAMISINGN
jgi:hypothetical protein